MESHLTHAIVKSSHSWVVKVSLDTFGIHTPAPGLAHQRWRPTGPGKERTRGKSTHQPVGFRGARLCGGTSQPQEATLAAAGNESPNAGARSPR